VGQATLGARGGYLRRSVRNPRRPRRPCWRSDQAVYAGNDAFGEFLRFPRDQVSAGFQFVEPFRQSAPIAPKSSSVDPMTSVAGEWA
jgi:hypothetical protein